jgi:hypothetical protein
MAQIYISSTREYLQNEREAAAKVVRRLGHQSITMEDYVATDQCPIDKTVYSHTSQTTQKSQKFLPKVLLSIKRTNNDLNRSIFGEKTGPLTKRPQRSRKNTNKSSEWGTIGKIVPTLEKITATFKKYLQ